MTAHTPTPLFIGDNGRIFCRAHGGATFQASGRDLSGQRAHKVTDADRGEWAQMTGMSMACESCLNAALAKGGA